MKKWFGVLNDYVLECDWKDLGLIKACVGAFGVMVGLSLPREKKKSMMIFSGIIFVASSALIAFRFLQQFCPLCHEEVQEEKDTDDEGFVMRIVEEA